MSDVLAIFGILLALGIALPGMLAAWWLLFPATVERARLRLDRTPWQCFFVGGLVVAVAILPEVILLSLPFAPGRFAAWAAIFGLLAFASLGAAGLAAHMGGRLDRRSAGRLTAAGSFVRGAVALELAAFFPVIGWLVFAPLAIVVTLGASVFALLHWTPEVKAAPAPAVEGKLSRA